MGRVSASLDIDFNDELSDLSPLLGVPTIQSVSIYALPRVTTLNLVTAGPETHIGASRCAALERVSIPPGVQTFRGLSLWENEALTTLDLAAVVEMSNLVITGNTALDSLDGLASLKHVSGSDFVVTHNPAICQSEVDAFIDGLTFTDELWLYDVDQNGGC